MAIACPDCGALLSFPPLPPHSTAICLRCRTHVETTIGRSVNVALACAVATLVLLPLVDTLPLLQAELLGQRSESSLLTGVAQLWNHDWIVLAGLSFTFVILLPAVRMGVLTLVLGALRLGLHPPWLGRAFRWAVWLDRWAMLDVFLLAVAVGYYYLTTIERLEVTIESGGLVLVAAGLLTTLGRAALDERAIWRAIGDEPAGVPGGRSTGCETCGLIQPTTRAGGFCPRCGARIRLRKLEAPAVTAALICTSFILLFPANILPMNSSDLLAENLSYTNFGYVLQLWHLGLWPLSFLTFWTSILNPALMIACLGWAVISVWRRSPRRLVLKTRLARMVSEAGRWSETGPLTIVFFVPLIDFGHLGAEAAGWGATAFILMNLLTIAASVTFDPRLMWDVAPRTGPPPRSGPRQAPSAPLL
ncbi:MAG TPA: paraquat-inducible protein A [Steroidobacteraceae bacterium]|nr:paraquat-inducible protein A [Steroidobacteraceae bacterium]